MHLLAWSALALLLVQISVLKVADAQPNNQLPCPPYHCRKALTEHWIHVAPKLFPHCRYDVRRCKPKKCGRKPKPCAKTCYAKRKWKKVKCCYKDKCNKFWVLYTKKCKCAKGPFKSPARPENKG